MSKIDFKLYFYQNNQLFKKVAVEKGYHFSLIVGSSKEANVCLENKRVSNHHLQLVYNKEGELHVVDLDSLNGTFLNGNKLIAGEDKILKSKDKLQLAGVNDVVIVVDRDYGHNLNDSTINIIEKLSKKKKISIGRSNDCDITIPSDTVSRFHAVIENTRNGIYTIRDLNSRNGTFVNGKRVHGKLNVTQSDKIFIGRYQMSLKGDAKDLRDELAVVAIGLEKRYFNKKTGREKKALSRLDLSVPSRSLLAIMGPSGCGKSTLLKALNGYNIASKGKVLIHGLELSTNYDYLKTAVGYVPQDDIVHKQLTIQQSMDYTSKLRLGKVNPNKITQILKDLHIYDVKDQLISEISGGQRKRVSIAVELLTDPLILFLDEPTSPLDPQTVDELLKILQALSSKATIVMVTHKPSDLEYMDEVIFLANGKDGAGHITYYGDTKQYRKHFRQETAAGVFSQLTAENSEYWIRKYRNPRPLTNTTSSLPTNNNSKTNVLEQYYWLTRRYFSIKLNDKVNSAILLVQAPIIAILICGIFSNISTAVLFMIAISAIWLGTQNAAREIVVEQAIYQRERMYNLEIFPYILSKITVLSTFAIIQSLVFVFILSINYNESLLELNNPEYIFLWMCFLSITSSFLGLLLSALVDTAEKAMTILPLILIPQIMLAGLIAKVSNGFVEVLSYLTLSRWAVEGFHNIQERIVESVLNPITNEDETKELSASESIMEQFHSSYIENFKLAGEMKLDFFAILVMMFIMIISIYFVLKKKDSVSL